MTSTLRPHRIQQDHIAIQEIGTETLLYNEQSHKVWCLNRSSACIWRLCDGQNTVTQIAPAASAQLGSAVSEEVVLLTLAELREKELIQPDADEFLPQGITRRQMISKAGLTATALLPVIASLTAPRAQALSGGAGTGPGSDDS